jgi:CheY-like chemotaxis protein
MEKGEKPYDLIFMDTHMPVMDGIEATPKIIALGSRTPIVAMTANVFSEDRALYKKIGMSDYLGKPFTAKELWRCLLRHLEPVSFVDSKDDDGILQEQLKADFTKNNQDIFGKIANAMSNDDITLAHRLAHTIKSNAGLIGKTDLQKAAAGVENALKGGKNLATEAQMNRFQHELNKVLDELKPPIETAINSARPDATGTTLDAEAARELFDKLEPLLGRGSPECLKLVDDLRGVPGSEVLIEQMEEFYFGAAVKTLAALREARDKVR